MPERCLSAVSFLPRQVGYLTIDERVVSEEGVYTHILRMCIHIYINNKTPYVHVTLCVYAYM